MNLFTESFDLSVAEVKEIGREFEHNFTSNFADGESDGRNNFEPIAYQWFNSDYRRGYLAGVARRVGIEHALIYGVEMDKVIFV